MHKIAEKEFTLEDFSTDQLLSFSGKHNDERDIPTVMSDEHNVYSPKGILECVVIPMLNECRNLYLNGIDRGGMLKTRKDKEIWWQMIQLLPSSYNQTRNVMLNYEVLANIYKSRKNHKLDEWREFCRWIESLPYSELIIQKEQRGKQQLINCIDPDTATDTAVDYAVQMAKDAARHYSFEKEE